MVQIDPRNPPNEMPDIVGFRPENPLAANFKPFIPAHARLREFTPIPIILGTLLGIVFGASSLYLVLKVGITVSASIPVAVMSITLFRVLSKSGCATRPFSRTTSCRQRAPRANRSRSVSA